MILPIRLFGDPVLRERAESVDVSSDGLQSLIDDMIDTMRAAPGIGLAATQVGRRERVFVVDLSPRADDEDLPELPPQPMVFINPEIVQEGEDYVEFDEGCLSIPDVTEAVVRPDTVRIRYLDRDFIPREETVSGLLARVVQHEYDHLEGVLFIDRISPLKRRLLKRRLRDMSRGRVEADYPVAWGSE
ncbi:MAG: peptide deformylase [Rhodothermales bacterium]